MASAVETQRLISVSLGKIAHSRAQRGGINLHKNLLVASVLNKARTAFMMENYNHQLSLQKQQQQLVQTAPTPAPASPMPVTPEVAGNSLSHVVKTCRTTPDVESRSAPVDTQVSSGLVVSEASSMLNTQQPTEMVTDKENISPSSEIASFTPSPAMDYVPECKQERVSGEQHIEAANQLSQNAQLAGSQNSYNSSHCNYSCKQSSPNSTNSSSVLKRRRVNPEAIISESPANKKARVCSSDCSYSQSSDISNSFSCEPESSGESEMQVSDSPQISNLVTIFNSGFSGLCVTSPSSPSYDYESGFQSDSSSVSHHHQWSSSISSSDSQSLHCSAQVERIGSLSSAIVLSA